MHYCVPLCKTETMQRMKYYLESNTHLFELHATVDLYSIECLFSNISCYSYNLGFPTNDTLGIQVVFLNFSLKNNPNI